VIFGDKLERIIGDEAFYSCDCDLLRSIKMASILNIGKWAFCGPGATQKMLEKVGGYHSQVAPT